MRGYPLYDSFFIASTVVLFIYTLVTLIVLLNNESGVNPINRIEIIVVIFFGIIALQAAWPVLMPRISLEDITIEKAILYEDSQEYSVTREAIVQVKPPLIPFIMERDYPIAQNLKSVTYDGSSSNLNIRDSGDGKSIQISLRRVTGWSFDEIIGKIKYRAYKPFTITTEGKNISSIRETDNLEGYELYPYDYRAEFMWIDNNNNFPVSIRNYTFYVDKDTPTWNSLKKWVDDGFCIYPLYSEVWDYRSSGLVLNVNGESKFISKETFNASYISLQAFDIHLEPNKKKDQNVIFKEITCETTLKDISPRTPYVISGKVKTEGNEKYLVIIVKNLNTNQADHVWAYPDKTYSYDLANLPKGYINRDTIQISICKNAQNCIYSKNITVDKEKGIDEVNFEI